MERWAANTLRTIGIVITACIVLVVTLFLLLMSMCAYQGGYGGSKNPEEGLGYLVGAVLAVIVGVVVTTVLARSIVRSSRTAAENTPAVNGISQQTQASSALPFPLHFSPLTQRAIQHLVLAIAVQIIVSAVIVAWYQSRLVIPYRAHGLHLPLWAVLSPFVLRQLPYALMIWALLKKLNRTTLSFAIAIPAVLGIWGFFMILTAIGVYRHPAVAVTMLVSPVLHFVILALAWRVTQRIGILPAPSSLLAAGLASFIYFAAIQVLTAFLYKFAWRFHG